MPSKSSLAPPRVDFSKIKTSIPIPNLIEVQKNSYEKFLQMDLLPNERDDIGLQTVFTSVFPISDFRGVSQLEFVDYSIGNWECKCGNLKGLHHLRSQCRNCGSTIKTDPFHPGDILCHHCGIFSGSVSHFTASNMGALLRWTDTNNMYKVFIDGANLIALKKVNGIVTELQSVPFLAQDGRSYTIRARVVGKTIMARAWLTNQAEPSNWMLTATDGDLASGFDGMRLIVQNGITITITAFLESQA
jgi:hypothetical protein